MNSSRIMKQMVLVFMLLLARSSFAQTREIPQNIRSAFAGTWQQKEKHFINTVKIQFEPGKEYAIFTDIGSGVAPAKILQATVSGNLLVIPARQEVNDFIEMEIIKGCLHLRIRPTIWNKDGTSVNDSVMPVETCIFKRIGKNKVTIRKANK